MNNKVKTFEEYRYFPFRKNAPSKGAYNKEIGGYGNAPNTKDKNEPFFNRNKEDYLWKKRNESDLLETLRKFGMSKSYFDSACKILEEAGLYVKKHIKKNI